ncbi:MAG: hypothetical protein IPJ52_07145 [Rhodocyclaceae bacterium]|nr:hypothetical protein [Rhodocyclaceae bacterium]
MFSTVTVSPRNIQMPLPGGGGTVLGAMWAVPPLPDGQVILLPDGDIAVMECRVVSMVSPSRANWTATLGSTN